MKVIYVQTNHMDHVENMREVFSALNFRTNLGFNAFRRVTGRNFNLRDAFRDNSNLEVLRLGNDTNDGWYLACNEITNFTHNCSKLKKIIGYIQYVGLSNINITNNYLLEEIRFKNIKVNLMIKDSPLISLESLQYLITNAANTSPITVTVHADVYAKIQDESNADWHSLLSAAQEKQITFATA